jgi:hypothetical protein
VTPARFRWSNSRSRPGWIVQEREYNHAVVASRVIQANASSPPPASFDETIFLKPRLCILERNPAEERYAALQPALPKPKGTLDGWRGEFRCARPYGVGDLPRVCLADAWPSGVLPATKDFRNDGDRPVLGNHRRSLVRGIAGARRWVPAAKGIQPRTGISCRVP